MPKYYEDIVELFAAITTLENGRIIIGDVVEEDDDDSSIINRLLKMAKEQEIELPDFQCRISSVTGFATIFIGDTSEQSVVQSIMLSVKGTAFLKQGQKETYLHHAAYALFWGKYHKNYSV